MTRLALSVAVSKVPGFPVLPGALQGARNFTTWAQDQGFTVEQATDDRGPVCFTDLAEYVGGAVDAGDTTALFLYLAGHGIANPRDLFLLSGARTIPGEVVDLDLTVRRLRRCGIPHVALFVDACRTSPGSDRELLDLTGLPLLRSLGGRTGRDGPVLRDGAGRSILGAASR